RSSAPETMSTEAISAEKCVRLQWGPAASAQTPTTRPSGTRSRRFNGAAGLCRRSGQTMGARRVMIPFLQWDRRSFSVDTMLASMRPPIFFGGGYLRRAEPDRHRPASMGPRILAAEVAEDLDLKASMGPPIFVGGDAAGVRRSTTSPSTFN